MTTRLLLNGKFTDEERGELAALFTAENVEVEEYFTKSVDVNEVVRVIFHNFDAGSFVRDFILGKMIESFSSKVLSWVHVKKQKAEIQIGFVLNVGENLPRINVSVPNNEGEMSKLAREMGILVTPEFIAELVAGETVAISWDKEKQSLRIVRF